MGPVADTARSNDQELKTDVEDELMQTPDVDAARVAVSVNGGAVTLFGEVDSSADRFAAKRAARHVPGVKAVADKLVVREPGAFGTNDADIASAVRQMLESADNVPADAVTARVRNRIVTLSGTVAGEYQRDAALRAAARVRGVIALSNDITVIGSGESG